ncbi:MAG: carboxy terminal-processing peptidase, partial [Pseudomonadales bacterium]|nr:carboxy terminal-processing peptidase [Pseudomonadales bacterium]
KALQIENKRRVAQGEDPLASLAAEADDDAADDADGESADIEDADAVASEDSEEEEEPDVLLTEAGNVLVDVLLLKQRAYALHSPNGESPK